MSISQKFLRLSFLALALSGLSACSAEVGSDAWCAEIKEKPKGEITANEAGDFTKHCLLK